MNRNVRALAFLVSGIMLVSSIAGCSDKTVDHSKYPSSQMMSDDDLSSAKGETVVLENGSVRFEMDTATTHFSVTDLASGAVYYSVPQNVTAGFSSELADRMESEITVTYYQEQSNAMYMYSGANSVGFGNYEIKCSSDTVRVYYDLSLTEKTLFVPKVLDEKSFDEDVLGTLDNPNAARRLKRYYNFFDPEDKSDDFAEVADLYPVLNSQPLYILSDSVSDVEKEEIAEYMEEAGYTSTAYTELLSKLEIEDTDNEVVPGFSVPVEYKLTKDGFTASVLADGIVEKSENHKLQTITFLEYFASSGAETAGSYIVPDGSGAVINMDSAGISDFKQAFYGADESIQQADKTQITKNLTLPIFGIQTQNGGVLAIVESAAEVGILNIGTIHNYSPQNHIYVDFCMRHMDATDVGELMQIPVYNLFSKHLVQISPSIRFVLLDSSRADYASMADYYRNYLLENDAINQKACDDTPIYLNYLCSIKKDATFIGIPYEKTIVLSTIAEIRESLEKLNDAGVGPLHVRLFGYGEKGLSHGVYNEFGIDGEVGSKNELKELMSWLEEIGGKLYLDADFQFVYTDGKGDDFSPKNDGSHYLNRSLVQNGNHDIVTRSYDGVALNRFLVSPTRYGDYSSAFIASLEKKLGTITGLSYSSSGQYLGGDYTSKKDLDRTMSLYLLTEALKAVPQEAEVIFENGNAYVLPYADAVLNVPTVSSRFDLEKGDIPLYQMVIHGLLPYTGSPQNLAVNPVENYLRTVEYGGALSYTMITGKNDLLVDTDYESKLYSLSDDTLLKTIIEQYGAATEALSAVSDAKMVRNEEVASQIFKTTYDNGHGVIVNYGDKDQTVDGVLVPATSFTAF